ncbi:MAG: hypothetical protein KBT31_00205 [Firmicutes bacterium]|nr:hypothetical protein [Candidatus Colimorpha enterica]
MKNTKLFDSISGLDEKEIIRADVSYEKKRPSFGKIIAVAAAAVLLSVAVLVALPALKKDAPSDSGIGDYGIDEDDTNSVKSNDEQTENGDDQTTNNGDDQTLNYGDKYEITLKSIKLESASPYFDLDAFDTRFLNYIDRTVEGSYMVSPLSFRYALGMLLAGADGETRTELLNALCASDEKDFETYSGTFNGFTEAFAEGLKKDVEQFEKLKGKGYLPEDTVAPFRALRIANSIWNNSQRISDFKPEYKEHVGGFYSAEQIPFTPDKAAKMINSWANEKTEGMIPELVNENYDFSRVAAVLMNALYFKDNWANPMVNAGKSDFTRADGSKTEKEYLAVEEHLLYYEDGDTQLVVLPMEGRVYMAFVIGTTDSLGEKLKTARNCSVSVKIPKIELETSLSNGELIDFLKEYGVGKAFDPENADFSRMADVDYLYVSDIIQKTNIKLDKDGVEAAAVSAIIMQSESYEIADEIKYFTADEPFSFFIYSDVNDIPEIMFAGKIVD